MKREKKQIGQDDPFNGTANKIAIFIIYIDYSR